MFYYSTDVSNCDLDALSIRFFRFFFWYPWIKAGFQIHSPGNLFALNRIETFTLTPWDRLCFIESWLYFIFLFRLFSVSFPAISGDFIDFSRHGNGVWRTGTHVDGRTLLKPGFLFMWLKGICISSTIYLRILYNPHSLSENWSKW